MSDLIKNYPTASDEIAKILGHNGTENLVVSNEISSTNTHAESTLNTSIEDQIARDVKAIKETTVLTPSASELIGKSKGVLVMTGRVLMGIAPYVVIFVVGVLVYYTWFADPTTRPQIFQSLQRKTVKVDSYKTTEFAALKKNEKANFDIWMKQYYFAITDASVLNEDLVAVNGLTNFENYLLKLNPKMNDVRHTGRSDAELVLAGIDPVTGVSLEDWQKDLVAKYFDPSVISARIPGTVAGINTTIMPRGVPADNYRVATNVNLSLNTASLESPIPTVAPLIPTITPVPTVAIAPTPTPTPRPSLSVAGETVVRTAPLVNDCAENSLRINTAVAGRLEVPLIGVNVPIIWTKDAKNFDTDLKTGVVHYPCTPLPGDIGTSYISGHSSNYAWIKASYNQIFAKLNDLPVGATFKVTVVDVTGKDVRLYYVVESKQIFSATDQAQFINTAESRVALSTCWPINTNQKRLVAFAKLDRVER